MVGLKDDACSAVLSVLPSGTAHMDRLGGLQLPGLLPNSNRLYTLDVLPPLPSAPSSSKAPQPLAAGNAERQQANTTGGGRGSGGRGAGRGGGRGAGRGGGCRGAAEEEEGAGVCAGAQDMLMSFAHYKTECCSLLPYRMGTLCMHLEARYTCPNPPTPLYV